MASRLQSRRPAEPRRSRAGLIAVHGRDPIYLDYNASAPIRPAARAAVVTVLGEIGNPSSVHGHGRRMHRHVEDARDIIAGRVNAPSAGVIFTAGGTEANNLALAVGGERPVLASAIEHDSVLRPAVGHNGKLVPVTPAGTIDLAALADLLTVTPGALVSLMLVNNETGVIQPVADVAALCRHHQALFHCDAVQALGRMPIDMRALGIDLLSLSAHKIGGPQGVGALIVADGVSLPSLTLGGGQERGRRAGTQNVAGIAGFAAAVSEADDELAPVPRVARWRDAMEEHISRAHDRVIVVGAGAERVAGVSCLAAPGVAAETQVMVLDLEGVAVSAGSACSSGKIAPSHVLSAMGLGDDVAGCAIRVSGGWASREADYLAFGDAYCAMLDRVRPAA